MAEMFPRRPTAAEVPQARLSRRQFLHVLGLLAGGGALAACADAQQAAEINPDRVITATPAKVLQSPQPPEPEPTMVPPALAQFLALSAALTGHENLDPRVGQVYLQSLENNPDLIPLSDFYQQAGLTTAETPLSLESLRAARIFEQEPTGRLASEITKMWYTGVYVQDGEPAVATFVDSLAWKSLLFTKPASTCGSLGFWAQKPDADVSR